MRYFSALILFLAFPIESFAEYRAYRLKITNSATGQERIVTSTMDHIQYPDYFPVQAFETISYIESWMCRGNTSNYKLICAPPSTRTQ